MLNVEIIRKVRQAHFRDGKGIREITCDFNLSRNTVRNIIRSGIQTVNNCREFAMFSHLLDDQVQSFYALITYWRFFTI